MKRFMLALLALLLLGLPVPAAAQDDDELPWELHWFFLMNYGGRLADLPPGFGDGGDWVIGEERLRMDLTAWSDTIEAEVKLKLDFFHDAIRDEMDVEVREAYLDYSTGPVDFRLGRQVITWGVGELVFINDIWPKNWVSFFSGRPMEYLKTGIDGARVRITGDSLSAEVVLVPTFEPDLLPGSDRFAFFNPFVSFPNQETVEPERTFENTEFAVRLYTSFAGFDLSGYVYKGFWHEQAIGFDDPMMPSRLTYWYPELNVYGGSLQGSLSGGILSLEAGYYDSRQDEEGLDPFIKNSEYRFLIGYSKQVAEDLTVGVQYFRKNYVDHDNYLLTLPNGMPASEDHRDEVTLSIRQLAMQQKLTIYIFGYYSPVDADYYLLPSVSYKLSDAMNITAGANIFGGDDKTTFLGQFDKNDNIYMSVRYDF
jgi:hypothetical protein